jgi:thiosulfate/3-mercaptopyruvate sulfurtransferase
MRRFAFAAFALLLASAPLRAQAPAAPLLVSSAWLADHMRDPGLVILHVGNDASFTQGHIPGARLIPFASFSVEKNGLSTEMPDEAVFKDLLEAAGVSRDSRIVIYTTANPPTLASRLYVTLDQFALAANASLLDGSLPVWKAENRAVSTDAAGTLARGAVQLRPRSDVVVDYQFVLDRLGNQKGTTVLDARDEPFWSGAQQNMQRAARPGRVPSAINIPFSKLVDASGHILPVEQITALFRQAGVQPGQPVVTYCHVGQQASLLFFAARLAGHDVKIYDGSYEDWSKRLDLRVEP